jgi:hypothetical protein
VKNEMNERHAKDNLTPELVTETEIAARPLDDPGLPQDAGLEATPRRQPIRLFANRPGDIYFLRR